jgi:hypothetical protein
MYQYEVFVYGEKNPFHCFSHTWKYENSERIFVTVNNTVYSLIIQKITHNLTGEKPIIRLNCQKKPYHEGNSHG